MPGVRDAAVGQDWFQTTFGFQESSYEDTKKKFRFEDDVLVSTQNGAAFHVGPFEAISLATLRARIAKTPRERQPDGLRFRNIVDSFGNLHANPSHAGSVFMVSSLFNCLNMRQPSMRPEDGVTYLGAEATQGSAGSLACPAATIFRNYFVNGAGQGGAGQLDCLEEVGTTVQNADRGYWVMTNGFCLPTSPTTMAALGQRLEKDQALREAVLGKVRVGVHWDTEVLGGQHRVCQVHAAAAPVAFTKQVRAKEWQPFACALLEAAFDAVLLAATLLAAKRKSRVQVFLTPMGSGDMGNRLNWVISAIDKALTTHAAAPLDVMLVHFKSYPRESFAGLERKRPRVPMQQITGVDKSKVGVSEQISKDLNRLNQGLTKMDSIEGSAAERVTAAFAYFDANGDGVIDRKEFTDVLRLIDEVFFTEDVIEQLIQEADVDGDGFVHYAEFAAWLCGTDSLISSRFHGIGDVSRGASIRH